MIVHIPIRLTLANQLFLSSKIGIDPLVVSTKNIYGMFIYGLLEKSNYSISQVDYEAQGKYTETVTIQISELIFNTQGIHWSTKSNHLLNLFIKEQLKDDFHNYMDYHFLLNKVQLRQAIGDWMQRSNLHEDALALRTLEKDYERYRKRQRNSTLIKYIA